MWTLNLRFAALILLVLLGDGCKNQPKRPDHTIPFQGSDQKAASSINDLAYLKSAHDIQGASQTFIDSGACATKTSDALTSAACDSANNYKNADANDTALVLQDPTIRDSAQTALAQQPQAASPGPTTTVSQTSTSTTTSKKSHSLSPWQTAGMALMGIGALLTAGAIAAFVQDYKQRTAKQRTMVEEDLKKLFPNGDIPESLKKVKPIDMIRLKSYSDRLNVVAELENLGDRFLDGRKLKAPDEIFKAGDLEVQAFSGEGKPISITKEEYEQLHAMANGKDFDASTLRKEILEQEKLKTGGSILSNTQAVADFTPAEELFRIANADLRKVADLQKMFTFDGPTKATFVADGKFRPMEKVFPETKQSIEITGKNGAKTTISRGDYDAFYKSLDNKQYLAPDDARFKASSLHPVEDIRPSRSLVGPILSVLGPLAVVSGATMAVMGLSDAPTSPLDIYLATLSSINDQLDQLDQLDREAGNSTVEN